MTRLFVLVFSVFLTSCSSTPKAIRHVPKPNLTLTEAQTNFTEQQGKSVRWGGLILETINKQSETNLQIIAFPLRYNGLPNPKYKPLGRFIIKTNEFLDPAIYTKDRLLTVIGKLSALTEQQVGEKTLTLPVIDLEKYYLWPKKPINTNYGYNRYPYNGCYPPLYFRPRYYYRRGIFY